MIEQIKLVASTLFHLLKTDTDTIKVISASLCAQIVNFAWLSKYVDIFDNIGILLGVGIQILTVAYLTIKVSNELKSRKTKKSENTKD